LRARLGVLDGVTLGFEATREHLAATRRGIDEKDAVLGTVSHRLGSR
jgi:hypothetical protein